MRRVFPILWMAGLASFVGYLICGDARLAILAVAIVLSKDIAELLLRR